MSLASSHYLNEHGREHSLPVVHWAVKSAEKLELIFMDVIMITVGESSVYSYNLRVSAQRIYCILVHTDSDVLNCKGGAQTK